MRIIARKTQSSPPGRNHSVTVSGIIKYGITGVEYLNMILEGYLEAAADNIIKFLSLVGREGYGLILILVRIRRGYKEGLAILSEAIAEGEIVESRAALPSAVPRPCGLLNRMKVGLSPVNSSIISTSNFSAHL